MFKLNCLLTNLLIANGKHLLATSTENKIQLQKINDTKLDRRNNGKGLAHVTELNFDCKFYVVQQVLF